MQYVALAGSIFAGFCALIILAAIGLRMLQWLRTRRRPIRIVTGYRVGMPRPTSDRGRFSVGH